jgi:membrane associated rhomboid family serine protease
MIFPLLNGIYSFARAPVTWFLFFINLTIFLYTASPSEQIQKDIEVVLKDELFTTTQGLLFANYIQDHSSRYPASLQKLAQNSLQSLDLDHRKLLGTMAIRDTSFLADARELRMTGDSVAYEWWQNKFERLQELRSDHPSYRLGVVQAEATLTQMLSYQFMHSGMSHFIGNMIFFLIFGTSLELIVGGLGLLTVYLISGLFAAVVFLLTSDSSAVPLIGASGAVSGVMALLCVLLWHRSVRYVFFLFVPKRGFAGYIFLPAWLTLILWFLSDLAGHWATPTELGGVAYAAHLGGELCGILIGLILLFMRRAKNQPLLPEQLPIETKPVFTQI